MAHYVMVRHTVSYYPHWREIFDKSQKTANVHGFTALYVLRDHDNSNMLTVIGKVDGIEPAKDLMASEFIKDAMRKAGVITDPEIIYLSDAIDIH